MLFHDRYSRQVLFPGIGVAGQERLAAGRVAVVGCGATGTCVSSLLARAGVGDLLIVDRDYVEPSNLQRQTLFDEADAAESLPKAVAAARKIAAFNSEVKVKAAGRRSDAGEYWRAAGRSGPDSGRHGQL